ncbi:biotin transporter BioY [Oscillospiraceae bacterium HV4-5-C5C]|nr:biotin transporter BioY [Oscillospiraceae bacterium HV4-5-C5C]
MTHQKIRRLILAALFAALTAIGAYIKIPLGPAPLTLQTLFTLLAGLILGPWGGALSQLLYMALGLIGLPVFTSGGGLAAVLTPSFGFVIGFVLAPLVMGGLNRLWPAGAAPAGQVSARRRTYLRLLTLSLAGTLVIYLLGVPYMYLILRQVNGVSLTFLQALKSGCLIFLPGDLLKCLLAAYTGQKLQPWLRHRLPGLARD